MNPGEPRPSEITPEAVWQRRRWLQQAAGLGLGAGLGTGLGTTAAPARAATGVSESVEAPHSFEQISRHNNYYEFSTAKDAVWKLAEDFKPRPWTLRIEGEVEAPRTWALDELLTRFPQEDRVYRLRCVEGWSLVVPWRGFSLAALLALARPTSRARYLAFEAVHRPSEMIGQRVGGVLQWPYREALRIDEAMHPLALMVTGLYGQPLPTQNGAPLRLALPWKYGFKSAKAITTIRLVEQAPVTSWQQAMPSEYGFYGNVNPEVPHPRWSQRREVRLGETRKRATLPFNGYADQVAGLYAGMDLARHF